MRLTYAIKYVSDMDAAVAFYRDKLGLEPAFESPFWSEFATGETKLGLHPASDQNLAGNVELGFEVDDLNALYDQRDQLGITFSEPPRDEHGVRLARIRDVDGASISVSSRI